MDLKTKIEAYEDLTVDKSGDKYEYIFPSYEFSKRIKSNPEFPSIAILSSKTDPAVPITVFPDFKRSLTAFIYQNPLVNNKQIFNTSHLNDNTRQNLIFNGPTYYAKTSHRSNLISKL